MLAACPLPNTDLRSILFMEHPFNRHLLKAPWCLMPLGDNSHHSVVHIIRHPQHSEHPTKSTLLPRVLGYSRVLCKCSIFTGSFKTLKTREKVNRDVRLILLKGITFPSLMIWKLIKMLYIT